MRHKPIIFAFFGIDGSGKSTQALLLYHHFRNRGLETAYSWSRRQPSFTKFPANLIKKILLRESGDSDGSKYLLIKKKREKLLRSRLFRALWINCSLLEYFVLTFWKVVILNRKRKVLICDRYLQDAIADFAVTGSLDPKDVFNKLFCRLFPSPDRLYFIDVTAEIGASRKNDGTSLEYLQDRVPIYRRLAELSGAVYIDGKMPLKKIEGIVLEDAVSLLSKAGQL